MTADAATNAAQGGNNQPLDGRAAIAAEGQDRDAATGDGEGSEDPDLRAAASGGDKPADRPAAEEARPGKPTFEGDDARAAIFAAAKANRGKNFIDSDEEGDPAADVSATGAADGDKSGEQTQAAAPAPKPIEIADDALVVVKVNGQERTVPFSEAKKALGMNIAAEEHLASAKRTRDEADDYLRRARADVGNQDGTRQNDRTNQPDRSQAAPEPGRASPSQANQLDKAKLSEVADRIQAGTRDEAAEALAELVQSVGGLRSDKPIEAVVTETVANVLEEGERKNEINRALGDTAKAFPDLFKDKDLIVPLYQRFMDDVTGGLRAIGVPESELREANSEQIVRGYQKLRRDPQYADKLKPVADLAKGAAKAIDDRYLAPARTLAAGGSTAQRPAPSARPGVVVADRSERKGALSPQPRSASTRADASQVGLPVKRSNPSDVVNRMAAARGQAAAG